MADLYESGVLSGKELIDTKREVERRQKFGKRHVAIRAKGGRTVTSGAALVRALKNQAQQQRLTIKRADITAARLRLIVQGLHVLLTDEHFVNMLRAENVHTMPANLARLVRELDEE